MEVNSKVGKRTRKGLEDMSFFNNVNTEVDVISDVQEVELKRLSTSPFKYYD